MSFTPWTRGPHADGSWISPEDRARIDRYNTRLKPNDERRVWYTTPSGKHLLPGQWSGNPWTAPVLLLLLNPGFADKRRIDEMHRDKPFCQRLEAMVRGQWDNDYPNPMLHPTGRRLEPWYATVAFAALHRHLVSKKIDNESAWKRLSQRCAVLELSPWASKKWSPGAMCSTTALSIQLARDAMNDPSRIVLLGRGEDDWKSAGLLDVDTLPKSKGVRVNQSRITKTNFPDAWGGILERIE